MKSSLIGWELKKLCTSPMLMIFILLCTCFNSLLTISHYFQNDTEGYTSYVADITSDLGSQMSEQFNETLAETPNSKHKERLTAQTKDAVDILDDYDTSAISNYYANLYRITGSAEDRMDHKFDLLQSSVNELAQQNASMDIAAASDTKPMLEGLFDALCRAVITEGMLLAVLMALYSCGYEGLFRAEAVIYSTKTGRGVQISKMVASAIASIAAYAILVGTGLAVFALLWHPSFLWGASMSSQFNYLSALGAVFPFITWSPFTVGEYLGATLLLGVVVVLIFQLIGFAAGLLARNMYYGFLLCAVFVMLNFGGMMVCGDYSLWTGYQLLQWTPIPLWWGQSLWFTGLDFATLIPYQECYAAILCLIISGVLAIALYHRMLKKDVKEIAA